MILNTNFRNVLAGAFKSTFDGGTLEIRTSGGTTLLATITLPGSAFNAASGGSVTKTGTWSATAVDSGVARVGRFISGSNQVDVTIAESAAEMIIDDENIVSGGTVTVTSYTVTMPAS
jgi:hypothetical protein